MTISVLFTDLRIYPSKLELFSVEWKTNITAREVIIDCLGEAQAETIEKDLRDDNREIIISWWHKPSGEISEVGGVGTLLWVADDNTIITIKYENENTSQAQVNESIAWTLKQVL